MASTCQLMRLGLGKAAVDRAKFSSLHKTDSDSGGFDVDLLTGGGGEKDAKRPWRAFQVV